MGDIVQACRTIELEGRTMKEVLVRGHEILLVRVGNSYYAAENRCPHMGGKLSKGRIEGTVVTCPLHGSQFDLRNGEVVRWLKGSGLLSKIGKALKPPQSLTTYNVRIEADKILLEI